MTRDDQDHLAADRAGGLRGDPQQLAALGEWGEAAFRDVQAAAEKLKRPGADFARNMDAARKRMRELGQEFDKVGTKIRNFGAGISVAITAPLLLAAKEPVTAWNGQVDAIQKVEAALASTKGISKQTSEGLQRMASDLQGITTFGDEAVLSMPGGAADLHQHPRPALQGGEQGKRRHGARHGSAERRASGRHGAE